MSPPLIPIKPLTPKQRQVLECLAELMDYEEIGIAVNVSPGRAKNIVNEIADLLPNPRKRPAAKLALAYAIAVRFQRANPTLASSLEQGAV